jgi:hypothetical protein
VTDPSTPRPAPVDPWGHETGAHVGHLLDASGHIPHQAEPMARLLGDPTPVQPSLAQRSIDPKLAIGVLLLVAVVVGAVLLAVL